MNRKIYTILPKGENYPVFMRQKNAEVARLLSLITGQTYKGSYKSKKPISKESYLLTEKGLSLEEGKALGIVSAKQIYGCVSHPILGSKTILHNPINERRTPRFFPKEFAKFVYQNDLVLPGYSAFNKKDIKKAYSQLKKQYLIPRLKHGYASFGMNQFIINSENDLETVLQKIDEVKLAEYGVVMEANVENGVNPNVESEAYSGGWSLIDNKLYSYIGKQSFGDTGTPHRYLGTRIKIARGSTADLKDHLKDPIDIRIIENLQKLEKAISFLSGIICSRYNFDFINGRIQGTNKKGLYALDPSFRMGGATSAEFLGKMILDKEPNINIVTVNYVVKYGQNPPYLLPDNAITLFKGDDPEFGFIHKWVYIEEKI